MSSSPLALVTGATGWLGSRLVQLLAEGIEGVASLPGDPERRIRCLVEPGQGVGAGSVGAGSVGDGSSTGQRAAIVERVEGDLTRPESLGARLREDRGATGVHRSPRHISEPT